MQQFFDDQIDIDWVFKFHLQAYDGTALHLSTNCIILEGNEDSPDKIELFSVNHYMATPIVFIRSEDTGDLVKQA